MESPFAAEPLEVTTAFAATMRGFVILITELLRLFYATEAGAGGSKEFVTVTAQLSLDDVRKLTDGTILGLQRFLFSSGSSVRVNRVYHSIKGKGYGSAKGPEEVPTPAF